ncbi:MAG: RES domain-containing protein [Gemmatimonadetes bacterium]|nr:RES domain-containing protein [Gemmatimonadota bacterium]MYG35035.1 RES domain-containing protein [Gemmatimonadota bacterium]
MTVPRRLTASLQAYRIGDAKGRWPVFSSDGARRVSGRWHDVGDQVIYASERYSTAMLETLVRWNGPPPGSQHFVRIEIPAGTSCEIANPDTIPGWQLQDSPTARRFGHRWYVERRSAILIVPSVVVRLERNIIINASHAEFRRLTPGAETPVWWDERLFS